MKTLKGEDVDKQDRDIHPLLTPTEVVLLGKVAGTANS